MLAKPKMSRILPALTLGSLLLTMPALAADGYRLGVMDKVHVRVAGWEPTDGTMQNWDALSGDYTVGPSGAISLPFVGSLQASGKTPEEMGKEIAERLQQQLALRSQPSASVEIAQYRPVFVSGDISTPGSYPFAPNLTVLKAVSLAGGLRRSESGQRFARDFINAQGDMAVYDSQRARLIARYARLQAEAQGTADIPMPKELEKVPNAQDLIRSETALMKQRRDRYELQLKALADQKALLQSEVESLQKKSETQNRQLEINQTDRDKIRGLNEQGLALTSRMISAEERTAEIQSQLLDIDTNILRARQQINQANQDEVNLRNDWEAQRAKDMQDTDAELEKLNLQLTTSRQLMGEAMAQSAEALKFDPTGRSTNIKYSIIRDDGNGPKEIAANETTAVQPGDVIKVTSELLMQ